MMHRINEIQRYTISIKRCQNQSAHICNHAVHIRVRSRFRNPVSTVFICNDTHICRMRLIRSHDVFFRKAKCGCKSPVIFADSSVLISPCKAEIHRCINSFAYTTQSGTESMHNIFKLFKCRVCKPGHTFIFFYLHMWGSSLMPSDFRHPVLPLFCHSQ